MTKQIKMTEEVRQSLAGLLPMSSKSVYSFTPEEYMVAPEQWRPIFRIKQLNNEQVMIVKQMMLDEGKDTKTKKTSATIIKEVMRKNKVYMEMTHDILDGWDNLYNLTSGDTLEYDGEYDTMMKLPESVLTVIFTEAMKITGFMPHGIL